MASLFGRLAELTRAHLHDLLTQYWPETSTPPDGDHGFQGQRQTRGAPFEPAGDTSKPPPHAHTGLPYTDELGACYRMLDLPFGAPLAEVTKRWKDYLKQCHPDRYTYDAAKQADATILTQQLNDAYRKIKVAWDRYHG